MTYFESRVSCSIAGMEIPPRRFITDGGSFHHGRGIAPGEDYHLVIEPSARIADVALHQFGEDGFANVLQVQIQNEPTAFDAAKRARARIE